MPICSMPVKISFFYHEVLFFSLFKKIGLAQFNSMVNIDFFKTHTNFLYNNITNITNYVQYTPYMIKYDKYLYLYLKAKFSLLIY